MFNKRQQLDGESVDNYFTELRHLAETCHFENITEEQIIRDRLVLGIRDQKVRERLLRENDLSLQKTISILKAAEQSSVQMKAMQFEENMGIKATQEMEVNKLYARKVNSNMRTEGKAANEKDNMIRNCKFCGKDHERMKCPAYNKFCSNCNRKNHFAVVCRSKSNNLQAHQLDVCEEEYHIMMAGRPTGGKRALITLRVEDMDVVFQIDSGAECNVLPVNTYKQATGDLHLQNLLPRKPTIVMYNGAKQQSLGQCNV
jgi:hypothetical protein